MRNIKPPGKRMSQPEKKDKTQYSFYLCKHGTMYLEDKL